MLDGYNYLVVAMTASRVNLKDKTIKIRIPQYHGLPNNPEKYKVENYVKDEDLPDAMIVCPIGKSISDIDRLLSQKGTLVYVLFSEGEMGYPVIIGWMGGDGYFGNTLYVPPAGTKSYDMSYSPTIKNTYAGKVYVNTDGEPGDAAPNNWFILPYKDPIVNCKFVPYDPWNTETYERHGGIDLGGQNSGYPIYAICDCTVTGIYSNDYSMGNAVFCSGYDKDPNESDANVIEIQYMHLNDFADELYYGKQLNKGDLIGYLGASGTVTGVHLHLGIKYPNGINGEHVGELRDPSKVLGINDENWLSPYEWFYEQPINSSVSTVNDVYSPYVSKIVTISESHYTTRTSAINAVVIHYVVGPVYDGANVVADWEARGPYSSSNYIIDTNGNIVGVVPENLRAYTSGSASLGSRDIDNRAITIECANNNYGPEYTYSTETIDALVLLLHDIGQRYGITWNFTNDESGNVHEHRWYQATDCPGNVMHEMLLSGDIIHRANNYQP